MKLLIVAYYCIKVFKVTLSILGNFTRQQKTMEDTFCMVYNSLRDLNLRISYDYDIIVILI